MLRDTPIMQEVAINFNLAQEVIGYLYRSASFPSSEFSSVKYEFTIITKSLAPSNEFMTSPILVSFIE